MPSFDAPIRAEVRPSPTLSAWHVLLATASLCSLGAAVGARLAADGLPAALCVGVVATAGLLALGTPLAVLARLRRRQGEAASRASLELHADGRLRARLANGRPLCVRVSEIRPRGPLITLRLAGERPWWSARAPRWTLARDAVDADAWRRLNAWARAGLPAVEAPADHAADAGAQQARQRAGNGEARA